MDISTYFQFFHSLIEKFYISERIRITIYLIIIFETHIHIHVVI